MAVRVAAVVAIVGALIVAIGVGLWVALPAALIVGGVEMVGAAYIAAYLDAKARRAADETPRRTPT